MKLSLGSEPRITAEVTLLSICRRSGGGDMDALLARIVALEAQFFRVPIGQSMAPTTRVVEPVTQ